MSFFKLFQYAPLKESKTSDKPASASGGYEPGELPFLVFATSSFFHKLFGGTT